MILRKLTLLFIFGLFAVQMNAQKTMNLQECIEAALANSLEVEKAKLGIGFSDIDVQQAKHNRYPSLSASTSASMRFGRSINPITDAFINRSLFSNSLGLNTGVAIFNGFQISNSIKQAVASRDASNYDAAQMERDVALAVANNYLAALFADENLAIANSQLAITEGQLSQINKLITAGARPANAALDVEAQMATDEQSVIAAENSKTIALLNLKQQMRLEPGENLQIVKPGDITVYSDPDALSFDQVYDAAYANQPSVIAAELRQKSAELGVKVAEGALLPTLNAGGGVSTNYAAFIKDIPGIPQRGYGNQLDDNLSANVGVELSIPIYDNYRNQLGVQRAKLNALNTENDNDQLINGLMTTIQQALTDAKASKRKLAAAEKSVAAQDANFANAQKQFDLGAINSFEFLTRQNNATQAKVNAVLAKYEYLFAMKVIDFYMGKQIVLD